MQFICVYHVILMAGELHILLYVGHVGCRGCICLPLNQ